MICAFNSLFLKRRFSIPQLWIFPLEIYKKLGLSTDYVFKVEGKNLVPAGVNVVDGKRIKEKKLEEEILVVNDERVVANVNTLEDLKIAELMLQPKPR